jgi:hypothetical protein
MAGRRKGIDPSTIEAGKYELLAVRWDELTSKPGEALTFVRHKKGDIVDLNVEEARRLFLAGAVGKPGELQRQEYERAKAQLAAAEAALAAFKEQHAGALGPLADDANEAKVVDDGTGEGGGQDGGQDGGGQNPDAAPDVASSSIQAVTDWVGTDPARAVQMLEAEKARGGSARSTLVAKLESLATGSGS